MNLIEILYVILSLLAANFFLLITFANSFDPDQDRQLNKLDTNCLTPCIMKGFFEKDNIKKKVSRRQQKHVKLYSIQRIKHN